MIGTSSTGLVTNAIRQKEKSIYRVNNATSKQEKQSRQQKSSYQGRDEDFPETENQKQPPEFSGQGQQIDVTA
jgi:hypothetical protein